MLGMGRVAVVTGSNRGIGFSIVKELCSRFDGDVYLTSRNESAGRSAVESVIRESGRRPKYHQLDIDDAASVCRLRNYLSSTYGGLDVLVNNAAVSFKSDTSEPIGEQAKVVLKTNVFGTMNACDILFKILKPHARVVNMTSSAGHLQRITRDDKPATELKEKLSSSQLTQEELAQMMQDFIEAAKRGDHEYLGWPNSSHAVSKIGISALTRIQQRQFDEDPRNGMIVNAVHPGFTATDLTRNQRVVKVEDGTAAPCWLALLPRDVDGPKGCFVWHDKRIIDWVNGPLPIS